ncbi:MAG: glycosyltransferase [Anaerolineales bacterium]|nr:glycosyltransferase [Anaerolineales bacterium]MBX3038417.1 glycosyltransferase [Anaerolineales bacterium]
MRIAMLSYHTCPLATLGGKDTGGMNVYVRDLTKELGKLGIHVDVFTRSQDEHVPHVLHDLGFGNRVVHIQAGPEEPKGKADISKYIPEFAEGIKKFAEEKGIIYDALHSHYWMSGLAAEILSNAWGGTPIVHMFHTLGEMKNRVARSDEERAGEERLHGERQVLRQAKRVIVATMAELTQLRFLYKADANKLSIIPPGVDTSHFYPIDSSEAKEFIGLQPKDRMILFVGRIEPLKGVDTLIQAMSYLSDDLRNKENPVHLAIVGGDVHVDPHEMSAEMKRLQKMSDDLCMGSTILFLGKRAQDTLPYYYSAAEVLVMPSLYESFGMVALEAMACGTPVIASEVGGLGYLVENGITGYTIPDSDPVMLSEKISLILRDHNLRGEMGCHAVGHASKYEWGLVAKQVVDVYKEVIG